MRQFYLLGLLFLFFSCSVQKEIYQQNPHILTFGTSGGFTNQTISYKLFSDGCLWEFPSLKNDSSLLKQIKKSQAKKIFKQAYSLGLDTLSIDDAGNTNKFITFKSKNFDNKINWSLKNEPLDDFYKSLIETTNIK